MLQRRNLLRCLITGFLLVFSMLSRSEEHKEPEKHERVMKQNLQILFGIQGTQFTVGEPIIVKVSLQNTSLQKIELRAIAENQFFSYSIRNVETLIQFENLWRNFKAAKTKEAALRKAYLVKILESGRSLSTEQNVVDLLKDPLGPGTYEVTSHFKQGAYNISSVPIRIEIVDHK